jgi:Tfp pilus assembly protein PilN
MEGYDSKASLALKKLEEAKFIDSQLVKDITSKIPTNLLVNSIKIDMYTLRIETIAPNRKAVAEFQLRLQELPIIGNVYVGSINEVKEEERTGFEAVFECAIVKEKEAAK